MDNAAYYEQIENTNKRKTVNIDVQSLGGLLKAARLWRGMTQKQVADKLNIPYQDYQKYEYNLLIPCQLKINKLVKILNLDRNNVMTHVVNAKMKRY